MEIRILASGSKGNAISLISGDSHLLIDVGISYSRIKKALEEQNIDVESVTDIILTHEHRDHMNGLRVFLNRHHQVKTHLTRGTMDGLDSKTTNSVLNYSFVTPGEKFTIDSFEIYPILISHDANEPIGLIIYKEGKKAVFITDTGYIHKDYFPLIMDADFYYVESNHDEVMLMETYKRPHNLKMRILGERGHLSNNEAARVLNQVIVNKKPTWAVAHISEDCNTQEKIEMAIIKHFSNPFKAKVVYTSQEANEVIKI